MRRRPDMAARTSLPSPRDSIADEPVIDDRFDDARDDALDDARDDALDDARDDARDDALAEPVPETEEEAWMADQLVRLVGGHLLDTMDVEDPAQADYLEWAAAEARAQLTPAERVALAEEARRFAARMRAELGWGEPVKREEPPRPRVRRARRRAPMPVARVEGDPADAPHSARAGGTAIRAAVAAAATQHASPYLGLAVCAGVGRALWDEPCDRWLALPPGVAPGEHVSLPVRGDSMQPLLHDGDTLLVRVGSACVAGDVV